MTSGERETRHRIREDPYVKPVGDPHPSPSTGEEKKEKLKPQDGRVSLLKSYPPLSTHLTGESERERNIDREADMAMRLRPWYEAYLERHTGPDADGPGWVSKHGAIYDPVQPARELLGFGSSTTFRKYLYELTGKYAPYYINGQDSELGPRVMRNPGHKKWRRKK